MPRRLKLYTPKGASRKKLKSSSTTPVSSNSPVSSSDEDEQPTDSTCTVGTQYELMDTLPAQLTTTQDEFVQATVESVDVSTQTDDLICADELLDEVQPEQTDRICEGNNDIKFHPLVIQHSGIFRNSQGSGVVAYYDQSYSTIRHVTCLWTLPTSSSGPRCKNCIQYRNVLRSALNRLLKKQQEMSTSLCDPSSHTNLRWLTHPEKDQRIKNLQDVVRSKERKIQSLQAKLDKVIQDEGIKVDTVTHNDLLAIMTSQNSSQEGAESDISFHRIFWQQQFKAASLKDKRQMRWHPAIIRWCLYLHHRSSGCYSTLRNTGVISLPSERTLRDYRHFAPSVCGFSTATDLQLLDQVQQQKPAHLAKYVGLVIDEMYVKEGLVFEKSTGSLAGYSDLGEVNNLLAAVEQHSKEPDAAQQRPLAKCMLVFMIRGLFNSLKFPYVQFPASSTKGAQLFPLLHKALARLSRLGLKVVTVTCDGASDNRRMYSLHGTGKKLTYKMINVFSAGKDPIFFISDPSHLIKTIRNCFARGKLWCNGYSIDWKHVIDLYHRNAGAKSASPGLSLVPKLTYEHIHLTNFSKMRVDLAVQVLSGSVSNALMMTGGGQAFETAYFIQKMDKFFDCFNVSSYTAGKKNRKPFQQPYRSANDFRLAFLKELILYLNQWEKTVRDRTDCEEDDKKHMLLSSITNKGIRMTVSSFLELIPYLFSIEGVSSFLSEKLSQDALEKFFGIQRQQGRSNENPTVAQFIKNTQGIRVINSIWLKDITGNCRGCKRKAYDLESVDAEDLNKPLKKRRCRHQSE